MSTDTALVIGLGNPGPQYEKTRHNVGFMVAGTLAGRMGGKFNVHKKSGAEIVEGRLAGRRVILGKPRSYMNLSGGAVAGLARFFSVDAANIIVVHDEL
ncbi:aminoacyl-tRNA hydrolase, partial [Rhodococcus erythropolis]|nr:aminoacyl-tRNA hydrolase [Rhodococcus erythropolis]